MCERHSLIHSINLGTKVRGVQVQLRVLGFVDGLGVKGKEMVLLSLGSNMLT